MDKILGDAAAGIKERSRRKFQEKWGGIHRRLRTSGKPRIIMLVDVPGWAWDIKTKNIRKWLADEYEIEIRYQHESLDRIGNRCDLYFAYDCVFVRRFKNMDSRRIVGGVTAHTYTNFPQYRSLLASCAAVHANSVMLYEELKRINEKAFYVPNGVDEKHFKFAPRNMEEEFTVGYVGKAHDRKGFKNYVRPACEAAKVKLKALTAKYNEQSKIDPHDMPLFYADIDCVVIASDMDGTPNQLLEAAATGRTFVGVKIGNVPEFHNGRNGFVVERNIGSIAGKLLWLKDHRKECEQMGREARKTVEQGWTWEMQARNYATMFRAVLEDL